MASLAPGRPAVNAGSANVQAAPTVDEIARWLALLFEPGQTFEIRAPKARRSRQTSWTFTADRIGQAAELALRLSGKVPGVYFTLNPVRHDLADGTAAKDRDILGRQLLLIDADPERPGDTSSTDVEKAEARELIGRVRDHLAALGWPEPIVADSGNGYHLLYAINLPNDDESRDLVKAILKALAAKFDTPAAAIDTSVYNASRISKLYGTRACKGQDTPERPHRFSRVLGAPAELGPVAAELLRDTAAEGRPVVLPLDLDGEIERKRDQAEAPAPPPRAEKKAKGMVSTNNRPTPEERARAYLAACQPAISGQDGHIQAFKVACNVGPGFDLPPDVFLRMLLAEYNPRCEPPWSEKELRHKVEDAYNDPKNISLGFGWKLHEERGKASASSNGHHAGNGKPAAAAGDDGRPTIVVECLNPGDSLGKWTGQSLEAMRRSNRPPRTFQRGGLLSRLRRPEAGGPLNIEVLSQDALRGVLDRAAYWGEPRVSKKGKPWIKYGPPRMEIVKDLAALPGWDPEIIPHIEAIVESPRFLPDGRLITRKGYHPEIRTFYDPSPELKDLDIPERPKPHQVDDALSLIFDDLLFDFPFANPASKANTLAVMLLPFVRPMIDGPTPLHMFEASTEGTGKGKLANACAYPSLGRDLPSTPQKEDEAEWRKAITTAIIRGYSHVFIDNMYNPRGWDDVLLPVDSANLAAALTQKVWTDRMLCTNKDVCLPIKCTWMGSGNNVEWSKELARRVVPIRLTATIENPCERSGFKHDPLEDWIRARRRELVQACLVLCQNWIAEDRRPGVKIMGSYEHYARVMGGILDAAPVQGFLDNLTHSRGKDRESARWPALVAAWHDARGGMATAATNLYDLIFGNPDENPPIPPNPELQVAFADVVGEKSLLSKKQRLGHALAKQDGRVWAGFRIVSGSRTPNGSVLYRLVSP